MSTFYRRDDWVTDALGNALSGSSVYVTSQPSAGGVIVNGVFVPPTPQVQLYADSAGVTPITQPVMTDGYGHAAYYTAQGTYQVLYYSPQTQIVTLPGQIIVSPYNANTTWNNDSSNAGTITGAIDGSNRAFTLSATPVPSTSLTFVVNGLVQSGWAISGATVTLAVAPHSGNNLNAIYQT